MEDAREARRKRLSERKTDRLAFITGQSRSPTLSVPQDVTSSEEIPLSETLYRNEEDKEFGDKQKPALKSDTSYPDNYEIETEIPQVASRPRSRTDEIVTGKLFTTSMFPKPPGQDGPKATNVAPISTIITRRDIEHSVLSTENMRLAVTLFMTLLMVSSYRGFLFGRSTLSSIITFRPLLSVLLTDVTIILGSVLLKRGTDHRRVKDTSKAVEADDGWPNDLSKILEICQMLYKVLSSVFMDCSICAVILICAIVV